jgi:hypothetical protein
MIVQCILQVLTNASRIRFLAGSFYNLQWQQDFLSLVKCLLLIYRRLYEYEPCFYLSIRSGLYAMACTLPEISINCLLCFLMSNHKISVLSLTEVIFFGRHKLYLVLPVISVNVLLLC